MTDRTPASFPPSCRKKGGCAVCMRATRPLGKGDAAALAGHLPLHCAIEVSPHTDTPVAVSPPLSLSHVTSSPLRCTTAVRPPQCLFLLTRSWYAGQTPSEGTVALHWRCLFTQWCQSRSSHPSLSSLFSPFPVRPVHSALQLLPWCVSRVRFEETAASSAKPVGARTRRAHCSAFVRGLLSPSPSPSLSRSSLRAHNRALAS